jgi:hypothetical protein
MVNILPRIIQPIYLQIFCGSWIIIGGILQDKIYVLYSGLFTIILSFVSTTFFDHLTISAQYELPEKENVLYYENTTSHISSVEQPYLNLHNMKLTTKQKDTSTHLQTYYYYPYHNQYILQILCIIYKLGLTQKSFTNETTKELNKTTPSPLHFIA